jgi:hypothetical protein
MQRKPPKGRPQASPRRSRGRPDLYDWSIIDPIIENHVTYYKDAFGKQDTFLETVRNWCKAQGLRAPSRKRLEAKIEAVRRRLRNDLEL